uniref:Stac-like, isoform R n=1 Tax=Drosophila melanogaster TaxID=7227 RepID=A0A0B4KF73_DROME|nr:Stac-like, isoform R [Drosophila melanogaster]AGB93530.2 Stac-like, isoform R [Drosophila melanogaster]|eukprot:NP_001260998.2 uncharacterized protein Dmel_CG43729, isoform R [Drosophila melanogaster]
MGISAHAAPASFWNHPRRIRRTPTSDRDGVDQCRPWICRRKDRRPAHPAANRPPESRVCGPSSTFRWDDWAAPAPRTRERATDCARMCMCTSRIPYSVARICARTTSMHSSRPASRSSSFIRRPLTRRQRMAVGGVTRRLWRTMRVYTIHQGRGVRRARAAQAVAAYLRDRRARIGKGWPAQGHGVRISATEQWADKPVVRRPGDPTRRVAAGAVPVLAERLPKVTGSSVKSSSGRRSRRRRIFGWRGPRGGSLSPQGGSMASYNGVLKDYSHSSLNEAFKSQNNVNFKLIKTVSDFSETLSRLYEEHATALQVAVSNYRKKNAELRKERPACHLAIFQAWETFLQEVETDSQACNDVASVLSRQVSRPMLDKSFHRKVQSRKIFTHRESFETIIAKTEEKLSKCRVDYKQCHLAHRQNPSQHSLTEYIDAHNAYVQQLHATNGMLEAYHTDTLPQQMQELEEIHNDLVAIVSDSLMQGAEVIAGKANDQAKRYNSLSNQCAAVSPQQDLVNFVRLLAQPSQAQKIPRRLFASPQAEVGEEAGDHNEMTPCLRNELVFDRHSTLSQRSALESLKREAIELELQIRQLQDSIEALNRTQTRGIEGQLYNKVNELQEDLSMKKFDLRAKQIHLAAIRAQKDLFVSKVEPTSPRNERKFSAATAPSMKTKWLKAFKSLKPAGSGSAQQADRRNGASSTASEPLRPNLDGSHHLQEYTYKKITACDVCSQILRGHTRQGLRCRICKLNAHGDCAPNLPRCQPKQKLLRRQKSTSELENRVDIEEETGADKSVQAKQMDGSVAGGSALPVPVLSERELGRAPPPDIPIVSVSELALQEQQQQQQQQQQQHQQQQRSLASVAQAAAVRAGRGVRPPPVAMPILGVQLQQQELQQQRGGLPVPSQDISSSSEPRYGQFFAPVSNMSSSAYISNGIGINYYTGNTQQVAYMQQVPATSSSISAGTSPAHQQQQQQQPQQCGGSTSGSSINYSTTDPGLRRRLFAGIRPLSVFGRLRQQRSSQHRSISLPETSANPKSETTRPFGEPLMLLKSTESNPDESKGNRRVR